MTARGWEEKDSNKTRPGAGITLPECRVRGRIFTATFTPRKRKGDDWGKKMKILEPKRVIMGGRLKGQPAARKTGKGGKMSLPILLRRTEEPSEFWEKDRTGNTRSNEIGKEDLGGHRITGPGYPKPGENSSSLKVLTRNQMKALDTTVQKPKDHPEKMTSINQARRYINDEEISVFAGGD